jgi:hypothetical protein
MVARWVSRLWSRAPASARPGTLNEPKPTEAEREALGRYGFTPRPPRFRPLADVGLLVKVFGCTASTANV